MELNGNTNFWTYNQLTANLYFREDKGTVIGLARGFSFSLCNGDSLEGPVINVQGVFYWPALVSSKC